jgi:hypothetical protein
MVQLELSVPLEVILLSFITVAVTVAGADAGAGYGAGGVFGAVGCVGVVGVVGVNVRFSDVVAVVSAVLVLG